MIVVSFHTPGLYERESARLVKSLRRFPIRHDVQRIESRGDWYDNTAHKPIYILDRLLAHRETVLWVDADAVVREDPSVLEKLPGCMAFARWHGQLLTGTMLFKYDAPSIDLLQQWIEYNASRVAAGTREGQGQKNLAALLDESRSTVLNNAIVEMELRWCWIFDLHTDEFPDVKPAIEHLQASRESHWYTDSECYLLDNRIERVKQLDGTNDDHGDKLLH